ncbi:MAG TPA: hypothetical protein VEC19_14035 [Usitatibacter sp.]|nr:hypothetical protein [Usitatibacter sp.]
MIDLKPTLFLAAKRLAYGRRGEPYRIAGRTLRYAPATRPIRTRYAASSNDADGALTSDPKYGTVLLQRQT